MHGENASLTHAEWAMMECLWERSPRTGREAVEALAESVGWSRSTTLTMLRRMTEKGLIACAEEEGLKVYSPLLDRGDAVRHETSHFLDRVFSGSLSMMLSTFADSKELSREEIDRLYEILRQAEKEGEK